MSLKEDLIAARARVEQATGPDRGLDGTLWWLVYLDAEQRSSEDPWGGVASAAKHYGGYGRALEQFFSSSDPYCLARRAFELPFTSSIDAALALVERKLPGWIVVNLCEWEDDALRSRGPWLCQLKRRGTQDHLGAPKGECRHGKTPPLAILAALLTAIESAS
jgi:hypothetical protein